jgi:hypothetical protein
MGSHCIVEKGGQHGIAGGNTGAGARKSGTQEQEPGRVDHRSRSQEEWTTRKIGQPSAQDYSLPSLVQQTMSPKTALLRTLLREPHLLPLLYSYKPVTVL